MSGLKPFCAWEWRPVRKAPDVSDDDAYSKNKYLDLPADPEEAFAVLQQREYTELEEMWANDRGGGGSYFERRYVDTLVAFDEVHDLGILTAFRNPPTRDKEFSDFWQDFRRHAEITSQKIMIEAARRVKVGAQQILVLDTAARQAIHVLINALREKLNELTLPEGKRESLFNKLNAFAAEVDRNRTRPEAFYSFAVETARVAREINDELKPLQNTIDRVLDWLDKAKKAWDALPPWSERKKIEGPPKRLPSPPVNDLDDDIPF
jgi:hypothetical protein